MMDIVEVMPQERAVEQTVDTSVPHVVAKIVDAVLVAPHGCLQQRTVEKFVDFIVPQMAKAVEVVQVVPQEPFPRLSEQPMDVDGVKPSEEDGHL